MTPLSTAQKQWIEATENSAEVAEILDFLSSQGRTTEAKNFAKEAIKAGADGSLISFFPFFKYPPGSSYASDYPKLTEYLKNKMPLVKDMPVITDAIQDITDLSLNEIQEDLQWGKGPTIVIQELDDYYPTITDYRTVGLFDPNTPEFIYLDEGYVDYLENDVNDQALEDGLLFYLGVVLLHEYTHQGVSLQGIDFPGEEGIQFEINAYGENLEPSSARDLILSKYYGYE